MEIKILLAVYIIVLLAQPQIAMIIQWCLDPAMRKAYPVKPWLQSQMASTSRSYQEHIINHAYISMMGLFALMNIHLYYGAAILAVSLAFPFIKEFIIDPKILKKPFNNIDWRQRLLGALLPIPLVIHYLLSL